MPATTPAAQRGTLKEAQRVCDRLIQMVENVVVGRSDCTIEFLVEFEAAAGSLIDALNALSRPLGDRLEHFRKCFLSDYPSVRPFTGLGLPLFRDDDGRPYADLSLCRIWLSHMRDLRDSLTDIKATRSAASRKPGAGRRQDPATIKLEEHVRAFYACERDRLAKEKMLRLDILARLRALNAADILRGINENNDHLYPLHGPESANVKRQVRRSRAWRELHEAEWSARPEEEPDELPAKDLAWAIENGLRAK
jgi:hypothetical protein